MADNKKKTVNWRDSLAAEAAKMKETVTVYVDGKPEQLARGDMSDEAWASLKKRAAADAAKQPERWSGDTIVITEGNNKRIITRKDQTDAEWQGVWDDLMKQYKGRDDIDMTGTTMTPEQRGYGEQWGPGTIFRSRDEYKRLENMPAGEEKTRELQRLKQEYDKRKANEQEKSEEQASADPGMSVRGQMAKMAMGATPAKSDSLEQANKSINATSEEAMSGLPGTTKPKGPVNALKSLIAEDAAAAAEEPAPVEASVAQPTKLYGGDAVSRAAAEDSKVIPINALKQSVANDLLTPAQQRAEEARANVEAVNARGEATGASDLNAIRDVVTGLGGAVADTVMHPIDTAKQVGRFLGGVLADPTGSSPAMGPQPGQPQLVDPLDPNAPATPPANAQPPVSGSGAQGGSMSVSARIPGNAAPPAPPPESELEKQIKQATREEQSYIAAKSALDQEKAAKDMETFAANQAQREKMVLDEQKRQQAFEDTMVGYERGVRDLQQQVLDLSKQDIDPNRFWNNKSDGQKAAAVIAGALFGFTGQGMQWLQRIDSLVAQDIQAQSANLQRKRGLLSDASQLQNNLVAMAEAKGLRGKAAFDAAQAMAKEKLANDLMMNAMNYVQPELKIKAEQAATELRSSAAKDLYSVKRQGELDALNKRKIMSEIHQNEAAAYAARVSAQTRAAGKQEDLDKLDPAALSRLAAIDKALAAAKEARTAIKGSPKDNRLVDQIAKNWVETLNTFGLSDVAKGVFPETATRMAAARQGQKTVLKGTMGEALNKEDVIDTAPMWGTPGLGSSTGWLDSQEEILLKERNAIIENAAKAKRDIGALTSTPSPVRSAVVTGGK